MAYGLKYKMTFDDIHRIDPAVWEIRFYFQDYSGDTTELIGSDRPLVITRGEDGQDRMVPIAGSKAEIEIAITDDSFNPKEFFVVEQFEIKIAILKGGSLWWSGFVKPDYCEFPYTPAPYVFKVIATDGIALLKNTLVDLTEIKRSTAGIVPVLELLMEKGLFLTQHGNDIFRIISTLHTAEKEHMFDGVSTRWELWLDEQDDTFMNVYSVLEAIAVSFGGRLFFEGGYAWFQRIADLSIENPDIWQYTSSDAQPTKLPQTEPFFRILKGDISSAEMIYEDNDSYITIMSAYKQSLIDLDYKFKTWLQNGDWHDYDPNSPNGGFAHWDGWDSLISRAGTGTIDDPYRMSMEQSDTTRHIQQEIMGIPHSFVGKVEMEISFFDKAIATDLVFQLGKVMPDSHIDYFAVYDAPKNQWYPNNTGNLNDKQFWYHVKASKLNSKTKVSVDLPRASLPMYVALGTSIQELPIDYDINDTIVFKISIHNPYPGPGHMEVGEVKVKISANGYSGETYTVRANKNWSKYNEAEKFTLIDDSTVDIANQLYYDGVVKDVFWTAHQFQGLAIDNLQAATLYSIMQTTSFPFETMTGTYYSNIVKFHNTIQRAYGDNKIFMQLYDEYDVKACTHRMTLAEIRDIPFSVGLYEYSKRKFKTD